jgi:hypothetical protein
VFPLQLAGAAASAPPLTPRRRPPPPAARPPAQWPHAALFAATLASTDALAIASVLRRAGAPEGLATLLEGESLLNDASGLTLFKLLLAAAQRLAAGGAPPAPAALLPAMAADVARLAAGGAAAGLAAGWATRRLAWALRWHGASGTQEAAAVLSLAYLTYYVADAQLDSSGVVAVVVFGLYGNAHGAFELAGSPRELEAAAAQQAVAFALNAVVFFFAGASCVNFTVRAAETLRQAAWNFALFPPIYLGFTALRAASIALLNPLFRAAGADPLPPGAVGPCRLRARARALLGAVLTGTLLGAASHATASAAAAHSAPQAKPPISLLGVLPQYLNPAAVPLSQASPPLAGRVLRVGRPPGRGVADHGAGGGHRRAAAGGAAAGRGGAGGAVDRPVRAHHPAGQRPAGAGGAGARGAGRGGAAEAQRARQGQARAGQVGGGQCSELAFVVAAPGAAVCLLGPAPSHAQPCLQRNPLDRSTSLAPHPPERRRSAPGQLTC